MTPAERWEELCLPDRPLSSCSVSVPAGHFQRSPRGRGLVYVASNVSPARDALSPSPHCHGPCLIKSVGLFTFSGFDSLAQCFGKCRSTDQGWCVFACAVHLRLPKTRGNSPGAVAQLGERLVRNEEVEGSNPFSSTYQPQVDLHPPPPSKTRTQGTSA